MLFRGRSLGVNAALWAVAFVVALAVLISVGKVPLHQGRRWMAAPLVLFAALLMWRTSPLLQAVNLVAVCGAVAIGALRRTERRVAHAQVDDYVAGAVTAGAATIVGAAELMQSEVPWRDVGAGAAGAARRRRRTRDWRSACRSSCCSAFSSPQPMPSSRTFSPRPCRAFRARGGWTSSSSSASRGRRQGSSATSSRTARPTACMSPRATSPRIGATEVTVALGAVNLLFLAFVLVQLRFLFGGRELVEQRVGLTYADYARHGFFELVIVAVLVLPLILGADAVADGHAAPAADGAWPRRDVDRARRRRHRVGAAAALAVPAAVRPDGAARVRDGCRALARRRLRLAGRDACCAVVVTCSRRARSRSASRRRSALNVLDPDALIARTNVARPQADVSYLASLSDDAVPTLARAASAARSVAAASTRRALLDRSTAHESWLSWNLSRNRAASLLGSHRDELRVLSR